jgi:hypothetical protein
MTDSRRAGRSLSMPQVRDEPCGDQFGNTRVTNGLRVNVALLAEPRQPTNIGDCNGNSAVVHGDGGLGQRGVRAYENVDAAFRRVVVGLFSRVRISRSRPVERLVSNRADQRANRKETDRHQ